MKRLGVDLVIINERASSYAQDLQVAIETAVRSSQSRPRFGEELAQGSVYVLRADLMSVEARALLQSVGPRRAVARRGRSPTSSPACPAPIAASPMRRRAVKAVAGAAAPVGAAARVGAPRVLQRPRRLRRGWPGVCDHPRRWPDDAGAVDQCHRQSRLRLPGRGRGQRLYLGGEQPREPAHALVERSGHRSARRGDLRARRR